MARSTGCAGRASIPTPVSRRCSARRNGRWLIAPAGEIATHHAPLSRRHADSRNAVRDRDGAVALIDFMPPRGDASDIVRIVRGERGRVPMRMELVIRFGFGVDVPWVQDAARTARAAGDLRARHGGAAHAGRDPRRGPDHGRRVRCRRGRDRAVRAHLRSVAPAGRRRRSIRRRRSQTPKQFWREWSGRCTYDGEHRDLVVRSLITLKALTYRADRRHRRGADDVAAREARRRAQLGLSLLLAARRDLHAARADERRLHRGSAAWRDWLLRAVAGSPANMQIMYGITGSAGCSNGKRPGFRATRARGRCGSATPRMRSCSSMSTAS